MKTPKGIQEDMARLDELYSDVGKLNDEIYSCSKPYADRAKFLLNSRHISSVDDFMSINDGFIDFAAHYSYQGECGEERKQCSIPVEFFVEPDANKARKGWVIYCESKKEQERKALAASLKQQTEQKEREEYLRLKKKFADLS